MTTIELKNEVRKLEFLFGKAKPSQRVAMRPGIERVIAALKSHDQPIPAELRRMEAALDEEEEDFFENMPV